MKQGEIVRYISAYEISPREAIPLAEALLIRTTGNIQYQYCPEDDDGSLPNRLKGNGLAVI